MTIICCVCHKSKDRKGWSDHSQHRDTMISHGYCPECYRQAIEKIETHFRHVNPGGEARL